tara:strand:- start:634 stop:759 length:126 start_codon:yes stop_codon:yes gene_type:complete
MIKHIHAAMKVIVGINVMLNSYFLNNNLYPSGESNGYLGSF